MKTRSSKTKVSYACLFPSPTLSYTITKSKRRTVCNAKVIELSEAPAGSLRVLFSFHSSKFLFRFFSDRVVLSVRYFQLVPLFFINTCYYFFLHYIIKKNFTQLVAKKWRNTYMIKTRNIILKIYVINFPIYKWSILLNI